MKQYRTCPTCGATLDPGEKCICGGHKTKIELFTVTATRCRRCGGILTSKFGIKNGIGPCCRKKELAMSQIDPMQIALGDDL
ncbi:MAG: DUF6011 domain-containing protein [Bacillota bacterium]|nr:DUF6011 domain-containing protein [Bacillota bacterium]